MDTPQITSLHTASHDLSLTRMNVQTSHEKRAPVVHPYAVLSYVVRGRMRIWSGSMYTVSAGDVVLIPEGYPHYAVDVQDVEVLALSFCSSCMTSRAGGALMSLFRGVSEGESAVRSVDPTLNPSVEHILGYFEQEIERVDPWNTLAIEGYLTLLAVTLQRCSPVLKDALERHGGHSLGARALAFIAHNATRRISLHEVAQHVGRSVAYTASVIKAETGQSAGAWIIHARLAAARQFLIKSDDTVAAIAFRVGFASPSQFHRVFKKFHTLTPAMWRSQHTR